MYKEQADLEENNKEQFEFLVRLDVKGETDETQRALLRSPEMLDKFYETTHALLMDIDIQFTTRRADSMQSGKTNVRNAYEEWRKGAVRYKQALIARVSELKLLVKARNIQVAQKEDLIRDAQRDAQNGDGRLFHAAVTVLAELMGAAELDGRFFDDTDECNQRIVKTLVARSLLAANFLREACDGYK